MGYKIKSPICLIGFNRPKQIRLVMECIKAAEPKKLYFVQDGPRQDKLGEEKLCQEVKSVVQSLLTWDCEVFWKVRESNAGCRKNVSEGITWFFENEEEGVILEDDCLPDSSFFRYCDELLDKYRNEPEIGCISANNYAEPISKRSPESYFYSDFNFCWGWASWRRAWKKYDAEMSSFDEESMLNHMRDTMKYSKKQIGFWSECFRGVAERKIDTWDYVWTYSCWKSNLLTCLPRVNLVKNIGFGDDATHTFTEGYNPASESSRIHFPLVHPNEITVNRKADQYVMGRIHVRSFWVKVFRKLKKYKNKFLSKWV